MKILQVVCVGALLFACGCSDRVSDETYREKIIEESKYIFKSCPDKELDSVWKFDKTENLVSIFTADSTGLCKGTISGFHRGGQLKYTGTCQYHKKIGKWYFFKESGDLDFINYYTEDGDLYQKWFIREGDTIKHLYPIIFLEPKFAHVNEEVYLRVNYIFSGIDTSGWDYFLVHDFIEREIFDSQQGLPYERYVNKLDGDELSIKIKFLTPEEIALIGYTLAIHRETRDSIYYLDILEQYLTIIDTSSLEF